MIISPKPPSKKNSCVYGNCKQRIKGAWSSFRRNQKTQKRSGWSGKQMAEWATPILNALKTAESLISAGRNSSNKDRCNCIGYINIAEELMSRGR